MPSIYAHTRFGGEAARMLPEELRLTVQRFQRLYNAGCLGPDFFFFYLPIFKTKMGAFGYSYHKKTGKEFFETAAQQLRQNPSEGGRAYLFGVLCHYCLDSLGHPLICSAAAEGTVGHTELETEFDRHLLTKDGRVPAHLQYIGGKRRLTWGECVTISGFFPPATAYTVRMGFGTMNLLMRALTMKNRKLLQSLFNLGGEYASQMVMYTRPNHRCAQLVDSLEEIYAQALGRYEGMAKQLLDCLEEGTPLGSEFEAVFG